MALIPLPLDSHSQHIGRSLQERDVALAELSVKSAIDFQHSERRAIPLQDDVHGTANAVLNEELGSSESFLVIKMIGNNRLSGPQGKARRRLEIGPDACRTDNSFIPAHPGTHEKPIFRWTML